MQNACPTHISQISNELRVAIVLYLTGLLLRPTVVE